MKKLGIFWGLVLLLSFSRAQTDFSGLKNYILEKHPEMDLQDKLIMVNVWTSDNADSRKLNKEMQRCFNIFKVAYLKNGVRSVAFVSINIDPIVSTGEITCSRDSVSSKHYFNEPQGFSSPILKNLAISKLPGTILFNSQGEILYRDFPLEQVQSNLVYQITRRPEHQQ